MTVTLLNLEEFHVRPWHLLQLCPDNVFDLTATPPSSNQHRYTGIMCVLKKKECCLLVFSYPTESLLPLKAAPVWWQICTQLGGARASKQLEVTCQQSGSKGNQADYVGWIPEGLAGTLCGICLIIVAERFETLTWYNVQGTGHWRRPPPPCW